MRCKNEYILIVYLLYSILIYFIFFTNMLLYLIYLACMPPYNPLHINYIIVLPFPYYLDIHP